MPLRLKAKKHWVYSTTVGEVERLIEEFYGKKYTISHRDGSSLNVVGSLIVDVKKGDYFPHDVGVQQMHRFLHTDDKITYTLGHILVDLCNKGIIKPGEYRMKMDA